MWFPLLLALACFCASCNPLIDPCIDGTAACLREDKWEGPIIAEEELDVLDEFDPRECGPLGSAQLINLALQNNPVTYRTWADARAAAFNWKASQSQLYPTVDWQTQLQFQVQKFKDQGVEGGNTAGNGNAGQGGNGIITPTGFSISREPYNQLVIHDLFINFLLFDFGGRSASIDAAGHALYAANWIHNRSLQDVVIRTLRAYYSYLEAQGLYEAQKQNVEDAKTTYESANAQYLAGVRSIVDMLQTKASYVNAQSLLAQAWGNLKTAMGQLAASIGLPANETFEVQLMPEHLPIDEVKQSIDSLLQLAKDARPDLASAYAFYRQRQAELEVIRSSGLPTVSANVNYEWANNIHFPIQNSKFRSATISLNFPIFAGFLYVNQEKQAKALIESAYADMQIKESDIYLEVITAYYALLTAGETVKFSTEFLQYAQKSYDATLAGYQTGVNTITDLLNAQLVLANARAQYIVSRTQWITSLANLSYATGNL